jgi:ribosomal protection tetracycline resistance protein
MAVLNLGIVAHVDAGKTSLTERLLYAAGVIDEVGHVDRGDTITDSLALERERGITIKTAVVSFTVDDLTVNVIDTPGHPDFIAEVDRVLGLLDGAVLVVSAVEGVQAQTRVLMRALQRLAVPTLVFINKLDRRDADPTRVVGEIVAKLTPDVIVLGEPNGAGTRNASFRAFDAGPDLTDRMLEVATRHDDRMLGRFVADDRRLDHRAVRRRTQELSRRGVVYGVLMGSAVTGAGIPELVDALRRWLPYARGRVDGPPAGVVFKVERTAGGERRVLVRMTTGTVAMRQRLCIAGRDRTLTRLEVFHHGDATPATEMRAGEIARCGGLGDVLIGDTFGDVPPRGSAHFSPPTFEAVIEPVDADRRVALGAALAEMADDDPFIRLRRDEVRDELSVSLYGEVQQEVIAETLAREHGVAVRFRDTTVVCIERVVGEAEHRERQLSGRSAQRPFLASVGLRVAPGPVGSGITIDRALTPGRLPMAFINGIETGIHRTLDHGLHGWSVPDCLVTIVDSGYFPRQSRAHGTFDKNMSSTANDFRLLTPLVLVEALRAAAVEVHEPFLRFAIETPPDTVPSVLSLLGANMADIDAVALDPIGARLAGAFPAGRLTSVVQRLPGLTGGEALLDTRFDGHRPVIGPAPERPVPGLDPRDRVDYLRQVLDRL